MQSNSQDTKLFFVDVKAVAIPNYVSQTAGIKKRKKKLLHNCQRTSDLTNSSANTFPKPTL